MKIAIVIAAFLSVGVSFIFGYLENIDAAVIALIAAGGLLVFAFLPEIKRATISTKGLELETRQLIREARGTLDELRLLAVQVASATISLSEMSGRLGGYSDVQKREIRDDALSVLQRLRVDAKEVEKILLASYYPYVNFDYKLLTTGGNQVPKDLPDEAHAGWKALRSGGLAGSAGPDEIEKFFLDNNMLTQDRRELIADYKHFLKHRIHRRPDVWERRNEFWRP